MQEIVWQHERQLRCEMTRGRLSGSHFVGAYLDPEDIAGLCAAGDAKPPTHVFHLSGGDTEGVWGKLNHPRRFKSYTVYLRANVDRLTWEVVGCLESASKPNKHTRLKFLPKLPACFTKETLIIGNECHRLSLKEYVDGLLGGYPYPWTKKEQSV